MVLNTVFWDRETQTEVSGRLRALQEAWKLRLSGSGVQQILQTVLADPATLGTQFDDLSRTTYETFSNEKVHVDTYTAIQRLFYWEPGQYELILIVRTDRPQQEFEHRWEFEIAANDADPLRLNIIRAMQATCGQNPGNYSFAYVRFGTLTS